MLQEPIENALKKVNFIEKYRKLSEEFDKQNDSFVIQNDEMKSIAHECGLPVKIHNGNQFFTEFIERNGFQFRIGFTVAYNSFEFDITIRNEKLRINSGGSFDLLVQLISNWSANVKKVKYTSSKDVKAILAIVSKLFEEIKNQILEIE